MSTEYTHAYCSMCGEHSYCGPLHGARGGPLCCLLCIGKWNAEHGRLRRARRVLIKALKAYREAGGHFRGDDFDELKLVALGFSSDPDADDFADLTSELLTATLALTHPDKHPPDRQAEAQRVTQELLALKPFVFPASEPRAKLNDASTKGSMIDFDESSHPTEQPYPCEDCCDTVPMYYCDLCKARWEKEQEKEREREDQKRLDKNARQRKHYQRRKEWQHRYAKQPLCATCGKPFKRKRSDARYCSAACRQRAYVKREGKLSNFKPISADEIERTITDILTSNPDNAFTTDDLCERVYPGLKSPERKHRAAVASAAKAACRHIGEHRNWFRSDRRGGPLVFFNWASITSYAIARLKCSLYGWWKTEEEMRAAIAPGGRDHPYVVEGGAWWKHCQDAMARIKNETTAQNHDGGNLTIRHAEPVS